MPDEDDINEVGLFLEQTVETYRMVVERSSALRVAEREALSAALFDFEDALLHRSYIVAQYAGLSDDQVRDAGLYGRQLRAKRQVAEEAGRDLVEVMDRAPGRVAVIRRWLKRVRILLGSLLKEVPGAEALGELLDLLDGALDRA